MMFEPPYDWLTAVVVAPFIGSFLSVLVTRLPAGIDVVAGRSHCDSCDHVLGARDLVPIASYAAARGHCRFCGAAISPLYPILEVAAIVIAVWTATVLSGWQLWATCLLGWSLLALTAMDLRAMILSDFLTLPLIVLGLIVAFIENRTSLIDHVIGAIAGFAVLALIAALYRRWRHIDGLGLGDAKLFAAAGAWVSWQALGGVLLIATAATLCGAIAIRIMGRDLGAKTPLPLGPGLALGLWLTWLYDPLMALS